MKGVRARLVLWNALAIGAILAAMGGAIRVQLRANLYGGIDRELRREAAGVKVAHGVKGLQLIERDGVAHQELIIGLVNPKGGSGSGDLAQDFRNNADKVALDSEPTGPRLFPVAPPDQRLQTPVQPLDAAGYVAATQGRTMFHDLDRGARSIRSYSEPVWASGRIVGVVQSVRDLGPVATELHQLDVTLGMLLPLALIVAAAAGSFLVGSAMRPLRRLTESARNLDPDLSQQRLPIVGHDEFADLAEAFNDAFDRTANAFATQRRAMQQLERFTGDAGHELRTPLGAIKGSVTFMLDGRKSGADTGRSLEIIDKAADRMTRLIADLLLLARQDSGQSTGGRESLSAQEVLDEAVESLSDTSPPSQTGSVRASLRLCVKLRERGHNATHPSTMPPGPALSICIDPDLRIFANRSEVARVFTNLLTNAITYARSSVRIGVSATPRGVEIAFEDDGEGIAPEHLSRLGERFYRPESARSREQGGTGLGLAIVKSIVESHGGTVSIDSTVGVGTQVVVRFPAAPQSE